MENIKKPPVAKIWAKCPHCRKKLILYDNTATASGIWMKCKMCGYEFELKIKNGKQETREIQTVK